VKPRKLLGVAKDEYRRGHATLIVRFDATLVHLLELDQHLAILDSVTFGCVHLENLPGDG
jgi:hypothetical protein